MVALEGVVNLVAGGIVLVWPGFSLIYFVYFAGFWAIIRGVTR